jgi:mRNA interferase MazF
LVSTLREADLIWLSTDGATGQEQAGKRPFMIVSVDAFNGTGSAMVCPITSHQGTAHATRNPLEVNLPKGLPIQGAVLTDQIRTIDWEARGAEKITNAGRPTLLDVRARLRRYLGI